MGGKASSSFTFPRNSRNGCIAALVVIVCVQTVLLLWSSLSKSRSPLSFGSTPGDEPVLMVKTMQADSSLASIWDPHDPLSLPRGQPPNLPSIRTQDEEDKKADNARHIYGGKGDGKHLGGFTEFDPEGVKPNVWSKMITEYGIRSFMDVGCGRGISTRWFYEHGVKVLCVEGSHDAVTQSFLPPELIVEHDYSRGPWWPEETYDAVWSVEFLEHVSRQYHFNYISTYRKAALIFVTSSRWGGWHHVEVHPDDWWIQKFESYGFRYSKKLSNQVKGWNDENSDFMGPDGKRLGPGGHVRSMKVFINPTVAALPQHAHLFPRDGCFQEYAPAGSDFHSITRPCGQGTEGWMETVLPESFTPLPIEPEMHQRWLDVIKKGMPSLTKEKNEEQ